MLSGDIFKSSYGDIEILSVESYKRVWIRFLVTGYVTVAQKGHIENGSVKDKFKPLVYGLGFIGDGRFTARDYHYTAWHNMMRRCYCQKFLSKNKNYNGSSVCVDWHNYQVFAEWLNSKSPVKIGGMELDKDILGNGNKLYSPETCSIVSTQENNENANAKTYILISPLGECLTVFNLSKFCRHNGLSRSAISNVACGISNSHKGWRVNNEI